MSHARGLPYRSEVQCHRAKSARELTALLNESVDRRVTPREFEIEGVMLKLLGALPMNYNYRRELLALYVGRLSAFYSPEFKYFVLIGTTTGDEVLAHELTHALQDQHYNLSLLAKQEFTNDLILGRTALFEGDANLTMRRVTGGNWCDEEPAQLEKVIDLLDEIIKPSKRVPRFLELGIAFPYFLGERQLCKRIREARKSGSAKSATELLSQMYTDLPNSSFYLLDREPPSRPADIVPHDELLRRDSLGPLGLTALFAQTQSLKEAFAKARNIGQDSLLITKRGTELTLEWRINSDEPAMLKQALLEFYQHSPLPTEVVLEGASVLVRRKTEEIVSPLIQQ